MTEETRGGVVPHVEGIVLAKHGHAHGAGDEVEDEDEHDDPAHRGEARDERLDNGAQAGQGLWEPEHADDAQQAEQEDGEDLEELAKKRRPGEESSGRSV